MSSTYHWLFARYGKWQLDSEDLLRPEPSTIVCYAHDPTRSGRSFKAAFPLQDLMIHLPPTSPLHLFSSRPQRLRSSKSDPRCAKPPPKTTRRDGLHAHRNALEFNRHPIGPSKFMYLACEINFHRQRGCSACTRRWLTLRTTRHRTSFVTSPSRTSAVSMEKMCLPTYVHREQLKRRQAGSARPPAPLHATRKIARPSMREEGRSGDDHRGFLSDLTGSGLVLLS